MRRESSKRTDRPEMSEKEFQEWLRQLAKVTGWLYYHTYRSRRSPSGFPDAVLVKAGRMIFAELKVGRNKPSGAQTRWLMEACAVPGVESYCWYPEHRPEIERKLRGVYA